jgi:hypothetical protein
MLRQIGEQSHARHGLFHRSRQNFVRPVPTSMQNEYSVLGLTIQPSAAPSSAR